MALTGFFLAFCCCGIVAFGGKNDRQRHTSRMIGVTTHRVDVHTREKDKLGRPFHEQLFHGDGENRGEDQTRATAADEQPGLSFASLFGPSGRRDGWVPVARV